MFRREADASDVEAFFHGVKIRNYAVLVVGGNFGGEGAFDSLSVL
jgi:hypothetical protein